MSDCSDCQQKESPEEPRRIVAMQAWYEGNSVYKGEFSNNGDLIEWWRGLPDDGALAFRWWYNRFKPVRLGGSMSGCFWYYLLATNDPAVDGDNLPSDRIRQRYPKAILKRGKLVGVAEIERVNQQVANATFWGD